MALITNILCPVDFSSSCIALAAYVKRAAALFGAKVSLVYVVDPASYSGLELYERSPSDVQEEHLSVGREKLDSFLNCRISASDSPRILASGDAASEIAQAARNGRFDLITMPTHAGIFSVCCLVPPPRLFNDADCPVLTSTHAEVIVSQTAASSGLALRDRTRRQFGASATIRQRRSGRSAQPAHHHSCGTGRRRKLANST
jgi:nucleotide-binding universal stress UspA family protein